ncbi:MAG: LapA family protein [Betaproteobacteria bacterium]|nr:LapA family protein [Betaproteobacteria bacterium]
MPPFFCLRDMRREIEGMQAVVWILRLAVFFVLLGLAIKNTSMVTVQFFFGAAWQLPLVFVMLTCFAAGSLVGLTAAAGVALRQRRDIGRLRREAKSSAAGEARRPRA